MSSLQIPASHHGHHVHDLDHAAESQQQSVVAHSSKTPVIAERFKTKQCRNYMQQGSCPYEARCMFAHGAEELRTKEMNLAEGLTTEEAVKQFQRRRLHANGQRLDGMHHQHHVANHHQGGAAHHLVGHNNPYEYYGYGSQQMYGAYGGMYPALETHYEPAKYTPVPFGLPEELVPATPVATTAAPKESAFEAAAPVAPKPKISSDLINLFAPAAVVEAP